MGYLLAATDNDAYNALVCTRFGNEFGRSRVFQIPMPAPEQHERKGLISGLRGQSAFAGTAIYEEILHRFFQGWRFQKTRFTDSYTFNNYKTLVSDEIFASVVVRRNGDLRVDPLDVAPEPGDILVNYVGPMKI
jgi:hypothetical protein